MTSCPFLERINQVLKEAPAIPQLAIFVIGASVIPLFYDFTRLKAGSLMLIAGIIFVLSRKSIERNRIIVLWFIGGLLFGAIIVIGVWLVTNFLPT
jgi:hypothetical protein